MGSNPNHEHGKTLPMPTVEEIWQLAGQFSKTAYVARDKKSLEFEDAKGARQSSAIFDKEYLDAVRNLYKSAEWIYKQLEKTQAANASDSIEMGQTYEITANMKPKYLGGLQVETVRQEGKWTYVRILEETGYAMSKGDEVGIPSYCLQRVA